MITAFSITSHSLCRLFLFEYSFPLNILTFHSKHSCLWQCCQSLGETLTAPVDTMDFKGSSNSYSFQGHFYVYQKVKSSEDLKHLYESKHPQQHPHCFTQNFRHILVMKISADGWWWLKDMGDALNTLGYILRKGGWKILCPV